MEMPSELYPVLLKNIKPKLRRSTPGWIRRGGVLNNNLIKLSHIFLMKITMRTFNTGIQ